MCYLKLDNERTEMLLAGLSEEGAVVKNDLLKKMRQGGVCKKVVHRGKTGRFKNPDVFDRRGIKNASYPEIFTGGSSYYLPQDEVKKLKKCSDAMTYFIKSVSADGENFVPIESLPEVKSKYEELKAEHSSVLASIVSNYETYTDNFLNNVRGILEEVPENILSDEEKNTVLTAYKSKIPSKADFEASQAFFIKTELLPALTEVGETLSEEDVLEINASTEDRYVEAATKAISCSLNRIKKSCEGVVKNYQAFETTADKASADMAARSVNKLSSLVPELKKKNVFNNPFINGTLTKLETIKAMSPSESAMLCQNLLMGIETYQKKTGLIENSEEE